MSSEDSKKYLIIENEIPRLANGDELAELHSQGLNGNGGCHGVNVIPKLVATIG